jgi:flagellar biosynthesis regulator FlaF
MCILKVYSDNESFESFSQITDIPVYSIYNKGERKNEKIDDIHTDFRISFDVSEKEWDDLEGQIDDTILFLNKYKEQIQDLLTRHSISDAYLDFALWSRLYDNVVNQNDYLPRELIKIAGSLNIGIEMGIYAKDAFEFGKSKKGKTTKPKKST